MPYPYFTAPPPSGDTTGATDTAQLQGAINSTPDTACLLFPCPAPYYINARLNVFSRAGLRLLSMGSPDTLGIGKRGTELIWKGPVGIDSALSLNYAHRCSVEGIALSFDGSTTPPLAGLRLDQWPDPTMPKPTITTTTACEVTRCLVTAPVSPPGTPATFQCVSLAQVSQQNVDLMTFDRLVCQGGAVGVWQGSNSNGKGQLGRRCQFNKCGTAVHFLSGSGAWEDCTAQSCGVDVQNDGVSDFWVVERWNSEGAGMAISVQGSSAIAAVRNSRWGNMTGPAAVWHRNLPGLFLEGNYFQGAWNGGVPFTAPFQLPPAGQAPITATKLHCSGNRWYQMLPKLTQQFGICSIGMPDSET
jgi:hypothetical protein